MHYIKCENRKYISGLIRLIRGKCIYSKPVKKYFQSFLIIWISSYIVDRYIKLFTEPVFKYYPINSICITALNRTLNQFLVAKVDYVAQVPCIFPERAHVLLKALRSPW